MIPADTNEVPVARLIGFEAKEIADGRALVTLAVERRHANPIGTLHGGTGPCKPRRPSQLGGRFHR
jgi:acyl-coenzyme A thioesterase PaaI-like protein